MSQPLNTTITVQRRLRAYRQDFRHEAVKALVGNGMRDLVVSVPGEESLVGQTRASVAANGAAILPTSLGGANNYVSTSTSTRGLPIVTGREVSMSMSTLVNHVNDLDFPIRLPGVRDIQIGKQSGSLSQDLFKHAADHHASIKLTGA